MRSGMAYPAIIERGLQRETINLGFSGNGLLDSILAVIMSNIDAACYVIDCGPNLTPEQAEERTLPFLKLLRKIKPTTPILLVEQIDYPFARFVSTMDEKIKLVNQHFNKAYTTFKKDGDKNIYYLPSKGIIGEDGEGTVDGVHLTDLGFYRMANAIKKKLQTILK
jgi:lysophospholipase L1-like esterase